MNITGVIVEYNPFHNGHRYHIEQARQLTQADVVVAIMSGNYVQRGEPALLDKWTRAKEALLNGVDVVFELPFAMAVQPGHIFAEQAVALLQTIGVDTIVCGAEHPEYDFIKLATTSMENHAAFTHYGQTYATTFYQELLKQTGVDISAPNDVLCFSYTNALVKNGWAKEIQLLPIKRIVADYHQSSLPTGTIASASAIRTHKNTEIKQYVPQQTAYDLEHAPHTKAFDSAWWPFLQYRIQTTSVADLGKIYQVTEGLEYKLKATIDQAQDYTEFMQLLKSKRYTTARLQRMLLYVLLNISDVQMQTSLKQPFLNLLGTTSNGQKMLRLVKKQVEIPMFSKIGATERQKEFALQYQVDQVFSTIGKQPIQNIGRIPWRIND
ncbi:nucleotidyltransferase [Periweissella fabaria]|uniref:tRNA(Met) cytidine acetate ligase n=1 Tax=Periweissella fabaria TaxID=546157 RepID=A0ABM8Z742_9LACO|nr:nucleotidyltransferase [Periweissella fabaria]MCM0597067.1 nucleotidyltransferase [Periweissella fabaria]CAH0417149.1 tRNA(Met) cytidine acetate ligase [Periweissella fabaria]